MYIRNTPPQVYQTFLCQTFALPIFLWIVFLPFSPSQNPTSFFLAMSGIQASIVWLMRSLTFLWWWWFSCEGMLNSCNTMDCTLPDSSVQGVPQQKYWIFCHLHLQGIFLTQKSNLGLLHCRQTLYRLSYRGDISMSSCKY